MKKPKQEKCSNPDIILDYNIAKDSVYHPSKEVTRIYGVPQRIERTRDYLIRYGVIQPESAKVFMDFFRRIRCGAAHAECVVHAKTATGELRWVRLILTAVYDEGQQPVRAVGILEDITQWREEQLQFNHNMLHREMTMQEALIYYEANITWSKVTLGIKELFQQINAPYSDDYTVALHTLAEHLIHPDDRATVCATFAADALLTSYARGERRIELEYRHMAEEGRVLWVRGSAYLSENNLSHEVMLYFYVSAISGHRLRELSLTECINQEVSAGPYASDTSILLQSIMDKMQTCTYIIDPSTHIITYINKNTQSTLPGAQPGRRCFEVLRGRTVPCDDCPIDQMVREGTTEHSTQMLFDRFGMWARVNSALVTVPSGQCFGVFHSFDFSEQPHKDTHQQAISELAHGSSLYDALSMSTDDYIIMCDIATKRFYFPKLMVEEFALPAQVMIDAIPMWVEHIHPDDCAEFTADIEAIFSGQTDSHYQEYRVKNKDGEWVWLRAKGRVERSTDGVPTLLVVIVTRLGKKSKVDHLTGLLDKYEFERSTRARMAEEGLSQGVILLIGLDNFRYINNIYGWDFGDRLLKESSLRLLAALPEGMRLYRLDGDKFGVFFPDADVGEVEKYYRTLHHIFRQHRQLEGHSYYCTVSGGCAYFQGECPSFATLYKQASYALDTSKHEGKNRITVYDERTMGGSDRALTLLAALHDSVERNCAGFEVYYQPQVEPGTFRVKSAEALLRWQNSELGAVMPAEFIPLLEQSGLIHRVGRWVLEETALVCTEWRKVIPDFTVSVNLSFLQLQDQSFLTYLTQRVKAGHITPNMLHLEITESCIADGSHLLGDIIVELQAMGFTIEMDDFGTGYSSLEILKNAPTDVVKIDQAFVRDISRSKFDETFIQIIVTLCHSVGIKVCLEGVETWDTYHLVESMGLDMIQGYLFGRPQPQQAFAEHFVLPAPASV